MISSMWYSVVHCGTVWYSVVQCYLVSRWLVLGGGGGCWRLVVRGSLGDSRAPQSSPLLSLRGQRQAASDSTTYQQSSSPARPQQDHCSGRHTVTSNIPSEVHPRTDKSSTLAAEPGSVSWCGVSSLLSALSSLCWRHQEHHNNPSLGSRQT